MQLRFHSPVELFLGGLPKMTLSSLLFNPHPLDRLKYPYCLTRVNSFVERTCEDIYLEIGYFFDRVSVFQHIANSF